MELKGQTAIVTGGGRGIGRAICLSLADEGANIVVASRTEEEIQQTRQMVEDTGASCLAISTDIREEEGVKKLISKTMDVFGKIDILVNDAGVAYRKPLQDISTDEYDEIMNTNVKGMFLCTKYALPHILKSDSARIVNISSGAGKQGIPQLSVYCASKFAVIGITESLASELARKVKVYAVCPGGVDTQMYRSLFSDEPMLKPEHIAQKVLELCLPDSKVPSGSSIEVYRPPF